MNASITHAESYSFVTQWGSYGTGTGQFSTPYGVAVDLSGNVYVADTNNNRIQKFNSSGTFITYVGNEQSATNCSSGSGDGQFYRPQGVAVDSSGNVYVDDFYNSRIQKFDSNGKFITKWGSYGKGNGKFAYPIGIAVDSLGNVYVAENDRIQKFDSNGNYLTQWGSWGNRTGQFFIPSVAVDSSGNVYVADEWNNRTQKFDSNGSYLTQWGSSGSGDGQFYSPYGIAVDSSGNVYVVDSYNNRIQQFNGKGTFLTQWGTWGSGNGQFYRPQGIAVDSSGNVYVADTWNNRIQKFTPKKPMVPVADFTSSVTNGYTPLTVQFTDRSKNATKWNWSFGDGNISSIQNPTHTFYSAKNYTVNLKVSNSNGTSSKIATITVLNSVKCNTSTISGYSFNDLNKNKIKNTEEAGLASITISLNGYDTCKGTLINKTTITNSKGYFTFTGIDPGVYVISENFTIGWLPTTDAAYTITIPSTSTKFGKNFGNTQLTK